MFQKDRDDELRLQVFDVEKVLSNQRLALDIPNYVNGRPTPINV